MGIQVIFNPYLALRAFRTPKRLKEECLPEKLESGKTYNFTKKGQRNYSLEGEIPLLEDKENQELSRPLASINILEATHSLNPKTNEPYTRGLYFVNEVYDINDKTIHFEGFSKLD